MDTFREFDEAIDVCRKIFTNKFLDYGASWHIMRPESVTDQIFIKALRIRQIEQTGVSKIDENIFSELIAIVNYAVVGLIQLELGCADTEEMESDTVMKLYEKYVENAKKLLSAKNHDYNEAWRLMRVESFTDLILQKINRTKKIENNKGKTIVSEGIDANYYDMLNYAVFYLITILEKG